MKFTIAIVVALIAILFVVWPKDPESEESDSPSSDRSAKTNSQSDNPDSSSSPEAQKPTSSDQKREITEVPKRGTWHPTEKGQLISPYNNQKVAAIGVVSGSKVADSDGKIFIVPDFEDSPFPLTPVTAPVPGRPGFAFNPWTGNPIDVRGLPPGTKIRDPADPDPTHILRTPPAEEEVPPETE